jgi:hypothetical protein
LHCKIARVYESQKTTTRQKTNIGSVRISF